MLFGPFRPPKPQNRIFLRYALDCHTKKLEQEGKVDRVTLYETVHGIARGRQTDLAP